AKRFPNNRERIDADDAERTEDGDHVWQWDSLGHGDVSDGHVESHGNGKEGSDHGDKKNAADGHLSNENLGGKKFDGESAEDRGEKHQRESHAKDVPKTLRKGAHDVASRLGPGFGNGNFNRAGD